MPIVTMPKLSDTMEDGRILRWLKHPGDHVAVGDVLVEVETDKADMEVESALAGVLIDQRAAEGETVPVGAVIALVEPAAGAGASGPTDAAHSPAPAHHRGTPSMPSASARDVQMPVPAGPPSAPVADRHDTVPPFPLAPQAGPPARVSPLARSRAADLGLDPADVQGSGPGGRVLQRDVEAAASTRQSGASGQSPSVNPPIAPPAAERGTVGVVRVARDAPASAAADATEVAPPGRIERVSLSPMRSSIARRMTLSKREVPHFYVEASARLDELVRLREGLRRQGGGAATVTLNHLILRATAAALRERPALNSRFAGDAVEIMHEVNLGIVTAVPDGLVVPVLRGADELDLFELAARARDLAQRARERRLRSEELSGGTFSVSNLGMYGVERFAAVINPPQAAILAVGAALEKPVAREGQVIVAPCVVLMLSCDHRAVDGAQAGEFLQALRARLEDPLGLLLPVRRADAEKGEAGA